AMMCCCAITPDDALPAEPYWPAYEFEIGAQVQGYGEVTLQCTGTSTFEATLPVPIPAGTLVAIIAAQTFIGNGNAMVTAVVAASAEP
ncbi:MAG: hypothetical protein ACRD3J_02425, partial [Thermoanaerobaculia bacterium]